MLHSIQNNININMHLDVAIQKWKNYTYTIINLIYIIIHYWSIIVELYNPNVLKNNKSAAPAKHFCNKILKFCRAAIYIC